MAGRRCFSEKIVESDDFCNLSPNAQALYLHLSMNSDDDGFVNRAQSIAGKIRGGKAALKDLVQARFLLQFDGVYVVKHWRISNSLKNDRLKPMNYAGIAAKIWVKPNRAYTDHPCAGAVTLYEMRSGIRLESNWNPFGILTEPNLTEPNSTEPNSTEPNSTEPKAAEGWAQSILEQYPPDRIGNRQAALDALRQAILSKADADTALDSLEAWKRSEQWAKDTGRYIPYLRNWILRGAWKTSPAPSGKPQGRQLDADEIAAIHRMMAED